MQTIKHKDKIIEEYNCATTVIEGLALFDLTNRSHNPVFKTVYKDTATFTTGSDKVVYNFSDCEVIDENTSLLVKIENTDGTRANNVKVYLSVLGEKHAKSGLSTATVVGLLIAGIIIASTALIGIFYHAKQYADLSTNSSKVIIYGRN